ncbi:MAG: serine/threonine protein kinase [Dehalococcoidia bacterium]|nr:serine/threonine protein kinase [Dehalococcoidia bacterium]
MARLAAGDRVGAYTLVASKGSGGMGSVWEAADPSGEPVAVKVMHDHLVGDDELLKRFMREFEVGLNVRHPNLVRMIESGSHFGTPYLVMELATGKSLRRLIERGGPFREWEAVEMTAQIADGLAALEQCRVVHRDLKSSNVVVDRDLSVKIIDFGIARVEGEQTLGHGNSFVGSAEFSSPEYYFGRTPGAKADVYSLGVVLFEMLTGRVPFRSDRYTDTLRMHAELPVPRPANFAAVVSPEVDELDFEMMQKQPDRRPSAHEVSRRCRAILSTQGRHSAPRPGATSAPAPVPSGLGTATWRPAQVVTRPPTSPRPGERQNRAAIAAIVVTAFGALALVGGAIIAAAMAS